MFFSKSIKPFLYKDRGDLAAYDYTIGNFTRDAAWHDLDISGVVGVGRRLVSIRLRIAATTALSKIELKTKGYDNPCNAVCHATINANVYQEHDFMLYTDANGVIKYYADANLNTTINFGIKGWYKL